MAGAMAWAELHCRSHFSFLEGAAAPEALVERAHALGYRALALTDIDGVYGVPRAHLAARRLGLALLFGAEVTVAPTQRAADPGPGFAPAGRVVLLALDGRGWARLCRVLTRARTRHPKGMACATWDELAHAPDGLACLSGGPEGPIDRAFAARDLAGARAWAGRIRDAFGERGFVELTHHLRPGDDERLAALARLGRETGLASIATQAACHAVAGERALLDVLACVRDGTTLALAGTRLGANGDRHLHAADELVRRFAGAGHAGAVERAGTLAAQATFSLDELRYRFPAFTLPGGSSGSAGRGAAGPLIAETPFAYLYALVAQGVRDRYHPVTQKVAAQISHELGVIERMNLAGYFLIVWDIVRFCREQAILCQGRGSAANSAVCYSIGITAVDPVSMELLFERFLSEDRAGLPDIDLDIAHQRREEVIQYVYTRYGRDRAAMANEVITYHGRSALRDVGKAFGLSLAQVDAAAKSLDRYLGDGRVAEEDAGWERPNKRDGAANAAREGGLDVTDPTIQRVLELTRALDGFPRHLGIHSGGMVITDGATSEVVPVENASMPGRTVVQWDKDDLESLGIIKIDLLGLGMLTAIDQAVKLVHAHEGVVVDLAHLPQGDPAIYDMISAADTVGMFQIESRAQMSFLPRHKPRTFYDLVIEVAIIRPGPIQGQMIHPYLRRRNGEEPVTVPHPLLEPVLRRTLGVPLFQEQGMKLAIVAANFTPGEADELRRAMGNKRSHARMAALRERLLVGMGKNGIARELAERIFKQLEAFADYGFPESHAASFALIVYASAYLKLYHPAAFLAALLNAQPMGFYAPHTLVSDARRHGVTVRAVCAARSAWDATLEPADVDKAGGPPVVRLGLGVLRGVGPGARDRFEAARTRAAFRSIGDFARRSGFSRGSLESLAAAGGFAAFGLARREALWQVTALPPLAAESAPLVHDAELAAPCADADAVVLPPMTPAEELTADFIGLGLSDRSPIAEARATLDPLGVMTARAFADAAKDGTRSAVAGMVITRQRPPTAKGMVFLTIEDETGLANLVLTPQVFDRLHVVARSELLVVARGKVERTGAVVHLRVEELVPLRDVATPSQEQAEPAKSAARPIAFHPRSFH